MTSSHTTVGSTEISEAANVQGHLPLRACPRTERPSTHGSVRRRASALLLLGVMTSVFAVLLGLPIGVHRLRFAGAFRDPQSQVVSAVAAPRTSIFCGYAHNAANSGTSISVGCADADFDRGELRQIEDRGVVHRGELARTDKA